jgi:hypothetical protein
MPPVGMFKEEASCRSLPVQSMMARPSSIVSVSAARIGLPSSSAYSAKLMTSLFAVLDRLLKLPPDLVDAR